MYTGVYILKITPSPQGREKFNFGEKDEKGKRKKGENEEEKDKGGKKGERKR
jgi:hypothetical protein